MRARSIHLLAGIYLFVLITGCKSAPTENNDNEIVTVEEAEDKTIQTPKEKLTNAEMAVYKEKLSRLFDSGLVKRNFNGGILVAKGGNILYEQYIGYKDPRSKADTIDKHTPFHLASTSKPFTGVAILKLAEAGKINIDDELTRFFHLFPYPGVTVKQLLCHRSGLPNYLYFMDEKDKWPSGKMVSNRDVLEFMIMHKPALNHQPGTRFNYCNTNYVLLALIAEKVTGLPFPQFLKESIFDPLKMEDTFVYTPSDSGSVLMSYKPSGAIWDNDMFENTYGDKNVYSTPEDMLKWDRSLYSNAFIDQDLLQGAFQPQSLETPSIHNYGLGWRMLNLKNNKKVIYHFGKWHGFTPAFARLTDEKAVVIILGNRFNKNIYVSAKEAYNIFGKYFDEDASEQDEELALPGPSEFNAVPKEVPHQKLAPPQTKKIVNPNRKGTPAVKKIPVTSKTKTTTRK